MNWIFFFFSEFQVIVVPPEIETSIGTDVVFNCTVDPLILLETVSIKWTRVTSAGSTFLTSMRTLSLKNIQSYDDGQYTCTGESGDRSSEDSGTIILKGICDICFENLVESWSGHAKGQLISKAIYGVLDSPQKRTKRFDLIYHSSNKSNFFIFCSFFAFEII